MSYMPKEWAQQMIAERWGRLVDDRSGKQAPQWMANSRPRELAQEYVELSAWTQMLEQELDRTTRILELLNTRLSGVGDGLDAQIRKNIGVLDTRPKSDGSNSSIQAADG